MDPDGKEDTRVDAVSSPKASAGAGGFDEDAEDAGEGSGGAKAKASAASSPRTPVPATSKQGTWQDDKHRHRLLLMSRLPKWNDRVESFCMNFHGNRIKVASSKNFVFTSNQSDASSAAAGKKSDDSRAILQFGKQSSDGSKFALDFRYPIAPVQAFAIFLTSTGWAGPKQKK